MSALLAYPVALAAALPTTLCVLAIWVAYARVADGDRADTVFLPLVFLFVPLIFAVSAISNIVAVGLGQIAGLATPTLARWVTVGAAGALVCLGCAWTQRGLGGLGRKTAPVAPLPVALFALVDMLILAGASSPLPGHSLI